MTTHIGFGFVLVGGCTALAMPQGPSAPGTAAPSVSAGGGAAVLSGSTGITEMVMPDLAGKSPADVWIALRAAGHVGGVSFSSTLRRRDEFRDGIIIATEVPPAGETADPSRSVRVTFDLPIMSQLLVPGVVGMSVDDALRALAASGIADVWIDPSGACRTDRVCKQSEPAGAAVSDRAGVTLVVGAPGNPAPASEPSVALQPIDAPPMRELVVPDVAGMSYVQAFGALEAVRHAGTVRFSRAYEPYNRPTSIQLRSPQTAGRRLRSDEAVEIPVSAPSSDGVAVPALVGKPAADAIAALASAGVVEINVFRGLQHGRTCKPGLVCTQEPAPGAISDQVTITLGFSWGAETGSR